jgi:hypothetical protein
MVGQLGVEHLLSSRDMERIESGCANKGLGDDPGPDVAENEDTSSAFGADVSADDLVTVFELGQDSTMKVEVEVKDVRFEFAIGGGSNRRVDQASNRDPQLLGDPEEQLELFVGVDAGHSEDDLSGIAAIRVPH